MIAFLLVILFVMVTCLSVFIPKYRQHRDHTVLYNLVSWCVTKDSSIFRCNLPLSSYVFNAQNDLEVPSQYRLSVSQEQAAVEELLASFQNELMKDYFEGSLRCVKSKYVIPGNHYFMFALNSFLSEHQYDPCFNGHDMHKSTLSFNGHGSWGAPLFDASYELSDFAVVYHKLYYITYLFCKNSKVINSKGDAYCYSDSIKKILDTRQIDISRM